MQFVGELQWMHVTLTAYGQWLPGDPRGFRTHRHREHVPGDYKNPPPVDYSRRHAYAATLMEYEPFTFAADVRGDVSAVLVETLDYYGLDVACVATAATHVHGLCKLPSGNAKTVIAQMKREVTVFLKSRNGRRPVWGRKCHLKPVCSCAHWNRTFGYISRHSKEGASAWQWEGPRSISSSTDCDTHAIREKRIAMRVAERGATWFRRRPR